MQIGGARRSHGGPSVMALHEAWQEGVAGIHVADACHAQLLHQPILQRPVSPFHAALCLAGVGADDLDVQLSQGTAELRQPCPPLASGLFTRKIECLSE